MRSKNFWLFFLFALTYLIFFCGMPRYLDDYWYGIHIKKWLDGIDGASLWGAITQTWEEHLLYDNVRLANIVLVPFMVLPKCVGSGIAVVLWVSACIIGIKIIGLDPLKTSLVSVGLMLWAFLMPWYDGMGVEVYEFNYLWPTFFAVVYLRLFLKTGSQGSREISASKAWALFFVGLFTGLWHEGFTAPLIVMCLWLLARNDDMRCKRQFLLLAGLSVGMIWFLAWPTSWHRLTSVYSETEKFGAGRILFILMQHLAFGIMCLVIIVCLMRKRWRKALGNPLFTALLIGAVSSLLVHFATTRTPRTGWWAEFCSVLCTMFLLGRISPRMQGAYSIKNAVVCIVCVTLTFAHQGLVDYWAVRIGRVYLYALQRHLNTGEKSVFTEIKDEHSSSLFCLFSPDYTTLLAPDNISFISRYYHDSDTVKFIPVPEDLRKVTAATGESIPPIIGKEDLRMRKLNGRLFMETDTTDFYEFRATVDFGFTRVHNARMIVYPFKSEADGKTYAFVYPWRKVVHMRIGEIKAISPE